MAPTVHIPHIFFFSGSVAVFSTNWNMFVHGFAAFLKFHPTSTKRASIWETLLSAAQTSCHQRSYLFSKTNIANLLTSSELQLRMRSVVRQKLWSVKPGSHERHKHKAKINTKTKHDICSRICEDKTRIFLCFVFCSALGLCLDYDLMPPLFCLLFCPYAYAHV